LLVCRVGLDRDSEEEAGEAGAAVLANSCDSVAADGERRLVVPDVLRCVVP